MPTTVMDATGMTATTSVLHAGQGCLGFRPPQPNAYLQHPWTPPIPFRTWLTSFKGYVRLLEFDRAVLDEGIKKTLLFQLLGAEGMHQFGNEPAADRLKDNIYSFIAFCDALETFFHKPVKPAWARLE
ncbi:MAG: hypothetical protein GY832_06895 [Chloroflexi bacterium]|nr:hypothetical protein [Chloroflexota bacterium]